MNRTDIHRPVNLVTEDYEYVESFDTRPPEPPPFGGSGASDAFRDMLDYHTGEVRRLIGLVSSSPVNRGITQCHHCGSRLRYVAILRHLPTGDHIAVGETCLDNRFSLATSDFQRLRRAAALDSERRRAEEAALSFFEGLPEEAQRAMSRDADIVALAMGDDFTERTLSDIRSKMWKYGNLSERQVSFVVRLVNGAADKAAARAARAAEVEIPAPSGRTTFTGVVVKTAWKAHDFGETKKLTIKVTEDSGIWLVWVSCPSSILDTATGETVTMTATLTPSDDKPHFCFGKRPSGAENLGRLDQTEDSLS